MPDVFLKLRKFEKVYNFVYAVFMLICKLLLVADILITSWIVLARYIKVIPAPNWGEELILTLMSYMAVLSAALAIKRNAHIRMTAFDRYLPEKMIITLDLIADLAVLALAVVMLTTGWSYATGLGAKGTFISMPWLSKFWQYFPIPLAGFFMIVFELDCIVEDFEAFWKKGYGEEAKE
jgi:TRAP-type C4-dicarboxylate transport system permease small subunit